MPEQRSFQFNSTNFSRTGTSSISSPAAIIPPASRMRSGFITRAIDTHATAR